MGVLAPAPLPPLRHPHGGQREPGRDQRLARSRLPLGQTVALLDLAKGLTAALIGRWLGGDLIGVLAGVAAMAGHWRPLFLQVGKGREDGRDHRGVGLGLATFASLAAGHVWIVVFLVTRYASVASMVSAVTLPLFAILFGASWPVVAFTVGAALGIVLLHKSNIARLFRGTENRFELRRRRPPRAWRASAPKGFAL